jgi:nucleotide-binding universal stress UspA family protein
MFRHILVPLDGSEFAEWAIPVAEQLAILTGHLAVLATCTVHLVRVVDLAGAGSWIPSFGILPEGVARSEQEQAHRYLERVRSYFEADGVQVRTEELTGDTVSALLRYEREESIDLVVMCSHLRSGVSRLAMGSVGEQLLRQGGAPVLLVHAGAPPADLQHAVVPLDGTRFAEQALAVVQGLAQYVVQRVTLVHVLQDQEEARLSARYLAQCMQQIQAQHLRCEYRILRGDPAQIILSVARDNKLLVMTSHCRNLLSRVARGSVAERVIHGGAAAVLLARRWPCNE